LIGGRGEMMNQKDFEILSSLRNDARRKVTVISRKIKVPVTTIYDKMRAQQKKGIVKKHVALLDYSKLGYNSNVLLTLRVEYDKRDALKNYLISHPNVNTLYRTNLNMDFLADVVFEDASKLQEFIDYINYTFQISDYKTFSILQELKKEQFLANVEDKS
jgi:DNA-binding Lrp family transcriptional regulator